MGMNGDKYLSVEDIAHKFNLNYETVRRWLSGGQLKGYKVGKMWRIKESDLADYLDPKKEK